MDGNDQATVHDAVGGEPFFRDLVEHFYSGVESDPVLRPLYPPDLTEAKHHLALFLTQYWGGPGTYSELRGHPRLRMRHAPFVITTVERDAWLRHMHAALDTVLRQHPVEPDVKGRLSTYFDQAADFLVNAGP